uniref:Selenoprotein F n=1 Tax=Crocodylus porosus TaxID=8502 RepID=A0A7M4FFU6_CROPO
MAAVAGAMWPGRLWFCLLAALQALSVYGTKLSSEACRELGFSSNLLCSSCSLLGQFSLNQLDPFCRQCCQEEAQFETRKTITMAESTGLTAENRTADWAGEKLYAGAVLEVCG